MNIYSKVFESVTDGKSLNIEHGLDINDVTNLQALIEMNTNDGVCCVINDGIAFSDSHILLSNKRLPQLMDKGIPIRILLTYIKKSECED